jgi:D-arginine dehydrogenase
MATYDFAVIGAGISGASVAYELAGRTERPARIVLIEAEDQPGYHSTGRSAALYTPNFGSAIVRRVNAAGRAFFEAPPEGFADGPLLTPRGALTLFTREDEAAIAALIGHGTERDPIHRISVAEALQLAPLIRPEVVAAAAFEPGVTDMDVAAIHQGFLRGLRQRGGEIRRAAPVSELAREGAGWRIRAGGELLHAGIVINAAGAWGDVLATMAGAAPVGLVPKRRTALVTDGPDGLDLHAMPLVEFSGDAPYLKPDGGRVMASLADETPVPPQDIQPDDMDVAVLVDWLETHTRISVRRAPRTWAGLRSFVADRNPVVGFDSALPGFFWLVGQGGYGIMMAPTLARLAAALAMDAPLPADLVAAGIAAEDLTPRRLQG